MDKLQRLHLRGFKSIQQIDLELTPLNILIGANGAGKSNLISFFKMLNEMMAEPGRLQQYIGESGSAQSLLYFGPKTTPQIEAQLDFEVENGSDSYRMRLFHAAGDTLIFEEETLSFIPTGRTEPRTDDLGAGHRETLLNKVAQHNEENYTARALRYLLQRCRVYHFHDTSSTAGVRQSCYSGDHRWLMPDASNLAALLLRFQEEYEHTVYRQIISTIRLIAPFFEDFVLVPNKANYVILNWKEKGSDRVFGPHQFSDGTLRAICLITLLLQPRDELPKLIVVDEPELGLHPYALNVIADLFDQASMDTQILISTQSRSFLDNFDPEAIIIVDRAEQASQFKRLSTADLDAWLTRIDQ
ncbi:MAG: AAA family ATPase [Cyanobacteria bacterium P01_F01_bin.150]